MQFQRAKDNLLRKIGFYTGYMETLYAVHSVEEAVKAGRRRFDHVMVARERLEAGQAARIERLVEACRKANIRVRQETREHLTQLNRDMAAAKIAIRSILQQVADRHGISARDVTYAMDGYADDLLGDLVYNLERELEQVTV